MKRREQASNNDRAGLNSGPNPPCPACGGPSVKNGFDKGNERERQKYKCRGRCGKIFREKYSLARSRNLRGDNPWCVGCHKPMKKAGKCNLGFQKYECAACRSYCRSGAHLKRSPIRARRRYLASLRWEEIAGIISRAMPKHLEAEMREDIAQEIMLAALNGDFNLRELPRIVTSRWRRIKRRQQDFYKFVSFDQFIPGAERLTYGDTLAG